MKKLVIAMIAAALLLAAGSAHAYAIYNHVGHKVCVNTGGQGCDFTVSGHSTHNGKHGAGLKNVSVLWKKHGHCYGSDNFDIPKSGFIRIYEHEVKIYNHHNKHLRTKGIHRVDCPHDLPHYLM